MRTPSLIALILLLCSCASGMKREGQCLATLTPEYLQAQTELATLEASWRHAAYQGSVRRERIATTDAVTNRLVSNDLSETGITVEAADAKFRAARVHYQPTLEWYERVYQRVRTRMEEEQLLSEVFWTLVTGPGLIFYPVVQWNVHSVMWDGIDPDAESDPIRRFCSDLEHKRGVGSVGGR